MGHKTGDDIRQINRAGHQKNLFHETITAFDHQKPDQKSPGGNGYIAVHSQDFQAGGQAGKFRHDISQVGQQQGQQDQKGGLDPELLSDQVRKAFPGDHSQAGHHLLHHDQQDGDRDQGPQQPIPVVRPGQGIGGDPTGIVVHVGRNNPGSHDTEEKEEAPSIHHPAHGPTPIFFSLRVWAGGCRRYHPR